MSLPAGARLGPYEIVGAIGAGGMGQVYKARDTRLDRTVALKILHSPVASDPEFRARFEREARTISALDHPHICALFDVGHDRDIDFLVMQYLEGETLEARLVRGPLPVEQALPVAIQIANALATAHRQNIVHRDLKPGNVMLSKGRSGTPQVHLLDFGLAKTAPAFTAANAAQPTVAAGVTAEGTILGTLQYMAPEQIEGQEADARTDLFAFGCVLYEMLTGRRAFEGKSQASLIGAILKDPAPRLSDRLPLAPSSLDHVVTTCLAKDRDDRWQSAADVERELAWIASTGPDRPTATATVSPRASWTSRLVVGALGVAIGAAIAWAALHRTAAASSGPVVRANLGVAPAESLVQPRPVRSALALSPDGRMMAFTGKRESATQLFLRTLDRPEALPVPNTDGASTPIFSPDGKWLGYYKPGALYKVPVDGGPTVQICPSTANQGASWGPDDTIVFANVNSGLLRVPASGGKPEPITKVDGAAGEISHRLPHFLPDGRAILFTIVRNLFDFSVSQVALYDLGTRRTTILIENAMDARYVESGHLIFVRRGAMIAVPFDLRQRKIVGAEVAVVADVMQSANTGNGLNDVGVMQAAVSPTGLLVHVPGGIRADEDRALVWIDRTGKVEELSLPVAEYAAPRLSRDGKRVALDSRGTRRAVWVYDLERGTPTAISREGSAAYPVWSPDGKSLVFAANAVGSRNLYRRVADATAPAERLTTDEDNQWPVQFGPNGETLLFVERIADNKIQVLPVGQTRTPTPLALSEAVTTTPALSNDGHWLAYASPESGTDEVYVRSFPDLVTRHKISIAGGTAPLWSRNDKELFFLVGRKLFSVDITTTPSFKAGLPKLVFDLPANSIFASPPSRGYDISLDGKRFLATRTRPGPPEPPATAIQITLNWFDELRAKAPAR
jgi:serine/threonine-protein kinase